MLTIQFKGYYHQDTLLYKAGESSLHSHQGITKAQANVEHFHVQWFFCLSRFQAAYSIKALAAVQLKSFAKTAFGKWTLIILMSTT